MIGWFGTGNILLERQQAECLITGNHVYKEVTQIIRKKKVK